VVGFYLEIQKKDSEIAVIKKKMDDFSCGEYISDNILVICRCGVNSTTEAQNIFEYYNLYGAKPARETQGSFIIVDFKKCCIICGRDRRQVYHLYLFNKDNKWYITTEENYLIIYAGLREIEADVLDMFLQTCVRPPFPILKKSISLMPGTYVTISDKDEYVMDRFWKIQKITIDGNYDKAVEKYGELLTQEIKRNIVDDSSGLFLSGGSDSALISAILCHKYKENPEKVKALHMLLGDDLSIEHTDVKNLQNRYNFNLTYFYPPSNFEEWKRIIKQSLTECSFGSLYISLPLIFKSVEIFRGMSSAQSTVFNGELCLLDLGFSDSSDKTRWLRRWLYTGNGKLLSRLKILPDMFKPNLAKVITAPWNKKPWYYILLALRSICYSFGRKAYYFAGLKIGVRGLPGVWYPKSFFPKEYTDSFSCKMEGRVLNEFINKFVNDDDSCLIENMNVAWYAEANNMTMQQDAVSQYGMSMCFPFSSVELMDFAASLPRKWKIDKKIQKDLCYRHFDMPKDTAYRIKFHGEKIDYFKIVYDSFVEEMIDEILEADYGILTENIRESVKRKCLSGIQIIILYGFALKIKKYNLKVVFDTLS
jgi:hypothetical protein